MNIEQQRAERQAQVEEKARELKETLAGLGRPWMEVATCNNPEWDTQEHFIMPKVAEKLRAWGYKVTSYRHECGVIDYRICTY